VAHGALLFPLDQGVENTKDGFDNGEEIQCGEAHSTLLKLLMTKDANFQAAKTS
jgi:hypothetical protein